MWYSKRRNYKRKYIKGYNQKIKFEIKLNIEEITVLIQLLEFAESEIQRTFKRFTKDDLDMKEIYHYYRFSGRKLRRNLREIRGF